MPKQTTKKTVNKKEEPKITCLKCGVADQSKFYSTKNPARKYFGKIPYCKDCIKGFYDKYMKKYKNTNLAMYYLCRKIDLPYIHTNYTGAIETINNSNSTIYGDDAIIPAYIKGLCFSEKNGWGSSFDESQGEDQVDGLVSFDEITKVKRSPSISNKDKDADDVIEYETDDLIQKWGAFENEDLAYLESEYLDWEDKLKGITDKTTDIMVKQVCLQCLVIKKKREQDEDVNKELSSLQTLLKTSGLIELQGEVEEQRGAGMLISEIEYRRPIKKVDPDFEDVDKIRDIAMAFLGGTSRAAGKENIYTQEFDKIYGKYSIDIIDNLRQIKEDSPDTSLEEGALDES